MTYIQSSFAKQLVLPYRHTVKAALYKADKLDLLAIFYY